MTSPAVSGANMPVSGSTRPVKNERATAHTNRPRSGSGAALAREILDEPGDEQIDLRRDGHHNRLHDPELAQIPQHVPFRSRREQPPREPTTLALPGSPRVGDPTS